MPEDNGLKVLFGYYQTEGNHLRARILVKILLGVVCGSNRVLAIEKPEYLARDDSRPKYVSIQTAGVVLPG